ncbi:MAG: Ig-like domain-containing protein, partial [Anaerolineae bacterium]
PGSATATLKFTFQATGPFPDQALIHNTQYCADADNAERACGADVATTVNAPVFALGKGASDDPVTAGERLTYTIRLTNTGHLTTSLPYTIVETLPLHTTYADSSPPAQVSASGRTLTWTLSSPLGIAQAVSVTFAVTVTEPLTDNLALINGDYRAFSDEVVLTAQGSPVTTTVWSWPTLSISKIADPDPVEAGNYLTYTLTVTNDAAANGPAQALVVSDRVPLSTTLISAPGASWSGTDPGSVITWSLSSFVWPGESATYSFTVRTHSPLVSGTLLTNQAAVTAENALSGVGTSIGTAVRSAPELTVIKSVTPAAVTAGGPVTYTVVVTNTGNELASGALITDTLPAPFSFGGMVEGDAPAVAGNELTWSDQTITPTADAIWPSDWVSPPGPLTLIFTATAGGSGTYSNAVTVTREAMSAATGPTAPVLVSTPDLRIQKSESDDPIQPGQLLTYTIVYSNASAVPATGVVITDALPDFIAGGYASGSYEGTITAGGLITWTIGQLDGNSSGEDITLVMTLTLPIADGTVLTNVANIACDEGDRATSGPVTTTVESSPDLVLTKAASPSPPATVSPDDLITYTLVFSNVGTATSSATITDALPVSLTQVVSTTTVNVAFAGSAPPVYTWTVGTLAPGEQGAITITGRVITTTTWGQSTLITNTAGITTLADSDVDGNRDAALVIVVPGPAADVDLTADPSATTVDCTSVVTAQVRDAWGNAVSDGTPITFSTSTATSGASPATGSTSLGYVTAVVTSTLPGSVIITGTGPALVSGTTSVDFDAGAPAAFAVGAVADLQTAGVPFTIIITATDQYANVATSFADSADLADDTGTLSPAVTNPAVGGVLTQSVTITRAWIGDVIDASASGTTACGDPWNVVGSSNPFTVGHNLAVTLTLAPQAGILAAGDTLTYTASGTDAYGNSWNATEEVTFATSGGNAFLGMPPGNNIFSATTAGVDFPVTGTIAGAGGPVTATTRVTVTHGDAVNLAISPPAAAVTAGEPVTYTAVATDAFGNVWDATLDAVWAAGGGNVFFDNVLSATVAGTWSVTGTLPDVSASAVITIDPGSVETLGMGPVADPQTAGVGFGLVITARDSFDNVVTDFSGALNLTDGTGTLVPTTWSTWSSGVANPVVTITLAASDDVITAGLTATPTIEVASNSFDVVGGEAATVVYTTPTTLRLCGRAPVTATVADQWGNSVPDGTVVTMSATIGLWFAESGDANHSATTVNGVATATLVAGDSSGMASTKADADAATSGWQQVNVTTPGVPYTIDVIADPTAIQALSDTASITATVYDCAAIPNRLSGETVDFAASFGTLSPLSGVTDGSGEATTTFSSTQSGQAVITATSRLASGLVTVTVQPPEQQVYLPLVLRDYRGVNLVVDDIAWTPQNPTTADTVVVSVTIRNAGPRAIESSFWVDLYLDPSATPAPGTRWDEICAQGAAWQVGGLAGGQSLTLRSDQGAPDYTHWDGSLPGTPDPHQLYAVVDSWWGSEGVVAEDREDDNVLGPEDLHMGP